MPTLFDTEWLTIFTLRRHWYTKQLVSFTPVFLGRCQSTHVVLIVCHLLCYFMCSGLVLLSGWWNASVAETNTFKAADFKSNILELWKCSSLTLSTDIDPTTRLNWILNTLSILIKLKSLFFSNLSELLYSELINNLKYPIHSYSISITLQHSISLWLNKTLHKSFKDNISIFLIIQHLLTYQFFFSCCSLLTVWRVCL